MAEIFLTVFEGSSGGSSVFVKDIVVAWSSRVVGGGGDVSSVAGPVGVDELPGV